MSNIDGVLHDLNQGGSVEDAITRLLENGGPDPLGMIVLEGEIQRARAIKLAVEVDPELTNLSDFDYVQYALTCGQAESVEFIVRKRIFTMQCFQQEYSVEETLEEGVTVFHNYTLSQPGFVLALEQDPLTGGYITIQDWSKLIVSEITSNPEKLREHMVAHYYQYHAWNPDFRAMRYGIRNMTECEGTSFANNFDQSFFDTVLEQLYVCYPKKHLVQYFMHPSTMVNIVYGLCKRFLSKEILDSYRIGEEIEGFEGHNITELFCVPTPELARQKLVQNMEMALRLRQHHQTTYSFPPLVEEEEDDDDDDDDDEMEI